MERRQEGRQLRGDRKDNDRKKEGQKREKENNKREKKQGMTTEIMKNHSLADETQRQIGERMTEKNEMQQQDWRGRKRKQNRNTYPIKHGRTNQMIIFNFYFTLLMKKGIIHISM